MMGEGATAGILALASLVGSGGGAWAAIRIHIHYLNEGVKRAEGEARRAHDRIDSLVVESVANR